jgi:hypothetical protein
MTAKMNYDCKLFYSTIKTFYNRNLFLTSSKPTSVHTNQSYAEALSIFEEMEQHIINTYAEKQLSYGDTDD